MPGGLGLFLVHNVEGITAGKTLHLVQRVHGHDRVRYFHTGVQASLSSVLVSLH